MAEPDYTQLWKRIQSGEQGALRQLFDAQFATVCQCIYRLVRDQHLTRDLAQNVFIRLWEKRSDLNITSSLPAYLRRMGHNEALAHLRSKKSWTTDEEDFPEEIDHHDPEEVFLESELSHRINHAIAQLPPRCRTIFQLSRFENLTYREISDQLSLSVKTVENQMGKALRILREEVAAYMEE